MKLSNCSGGESYGGEDGIGGRSIRLPLDPFLDPGQPFGRLMDVVPLGDVGKSLEQLFEAFVARRGGRRHRSLGAAARRMNDRLQFLDRVHAATTPRDGPAPTTGADRSTVGPHIFLAG